MQSKGEKEARSQSAIIEILKKKGKISPDDKSYWITTIEGEKKAPMPTKLDINGIQAREGDKISFQAILNSSKHGISKIEWRKPYIANASGIRIEGDWIGNGSLTLDLPFTIINY